MGKFRFHKWTEIGSLCIVLGSCIKFAYHLYYIFMDIGITKGAVIEVIFNVYHLSIITTMKEYELYILPMYVISSLLILYLIGLISAYINHCKQKDRKDNNILES